MKRLFPLLIVLILTNVPLSCFGPRCGSGGPTTSTVAGLSTTIGRYGPSGFEELPSTDFTTAAIRVEVSEVVYAVLNRLEMHVPLGFVNSALACSPPPPDPTQALSNISIVSSDSIFAGTDDLPMGSDISSYFQIVEGSEEMPISAFIDRQNADLLLFGGAYDALLFQLVNAPARAINQRLTIQFDFADGATFTMETDPFVIDL